MYQKVQIITEVKTSSPFGFQSDKSWEELFHLANKEGDILSIHTDSRWGGSFDLIRKARTLTDKPILAKGIHATDKEVEQAILAGADYVLVVGRIPAIYQDKCFIEPYSLDELRCIPQEYKVVWNSRNLADGSLKRETFEEARSLFSGWLCQASNLKSVNDIKSGADAVLVGTYLEDFARSLQEAR